MCSMQGNKKDTKSRNPYSNDHRAFERQLALERRSVAELLLDIYESGLERKRRQLDPERPDFTMKERS
jgi:hypothetical protein